jgi:cytochrome c553
MESRAEPSPRAALHVLVSLAILALFLLKVLFIRLYRSYYGQVGTIGIVITVLSFMLVGLSGGYFLLVSGFGSDKTVDKSVHYSLHGAFLTVKKNGEPGSAAVRTDRRSIERGRTLFLSKCATCHDPDSTTTTVGPGLKGLLKNPTLPISKHPATVESVRFQLRQPMGRMPSYDYLSDDEMSDLLAYLNTL